MHPANSGADCLPPCQKASARRRGRPQCAGRLAGRCMLLSCCMVLACLAVNSAKGCRRWQVVQYARSPYTVSVARFAPLLSSSSASVGAASRRQSLALGLGNPMRQPLYRAWPARKWRTIAAVLGQHHVARLEVAVQYAAFMGTGQRAYHGRAMCDYSSRQARQG